MREIPTHLPSELVPLAWLIGEWEGDGMVEYEVDGELRLHPFRQRVSFTHTDLPFLEYRATSWLLPVDDDADGAQADAQADTSAVPGGSLRGVADPVDTTAAADAPATDAPRPFLPEGVDALLPQGPVLPADLANDTGNLLPLTSEMGYWRLARARDDGDVGPGMLPPSASPTITNADGVEALRGEHEGFDLEVTLAHPTGVSELYHGVIRGPRVELATEAVVRAAGAREYRAATRMYGLVQGRMFWAWDIAALGRELATHASAQLTRIE